MNFGRKGRKISESKNLENISEFYLAYLRSSYPGQPQCQFVLYVEDVSLENSAILYCIGESRGTAQRQGNPSRGQTRPASYPTTPLPLTSLPRVAAFLSWISPMRPTNTAKLRAFEQITFRYDLSPLSERKGSKLTYRQKSTAVRVISRAGDSEARPLKRLF